MVTCSVIGKGRFASLSTTSLYSETLHWGSCMKEWSSSNVCTIVFGILLVSRRCCHLIVSLLENRSVCTVQSRHLLFKVLFAKVCKCSAKQNSIHRISYIELLLHRSSGVNYVPTSGMLYVVDCCASRCKRWDF